MKDRDARSALIMQLDAPYLCDIECGLPTNELGGSSSHQDRLSQQLVASPVQRSFGGSAGRKQTGGHLGLHGSSTATRRLLGR